MKDIWCVRGPTRFISFARKSNTTSVHDCMGNRRRSFVLHDNSSSSHARTYRRVPVLRHKPTITFRSARLCFSQSSACSSFSQQSLRFHAHRAFVRLRCLLCTMAIACTKRTCICTVCLSFRDFSSAVFFFAWPIRSPLWRWRFFFLSLLGCAIVLFSRWARPKTDRSTPQIYVVQVIYHIFVSLSSLSSLRIFVRPDHSVNNHPIYVSFFPPNCIQSLTFFSLNNINCDTVHFRTKPKYNRSDSMQRKVYVYDNTHSDIETIINTVHIAHIEMSRTKPTSRHTFYLHFHHFRSACSWFFFSPFVRSSLTIDRLQSVCGLCPCYAVIGMCSSISDNCRHAQFGIVETVRTQNSWPFVIVAGMCVCVFLSMNFVTTIANQDFVYITDIFFFREIWIGTATSWAHILYMICFAFGVATILSVCVCEYSLFSHSIPVYS